MIKIKIFLIHTVLIFCAFTIHAQSKTVPFKLFFEKVYLHTDRDLYTQGDTVWFKAYLVNAQNNQPIGISGNLYVELIALDSAKLINRQVIRMDYGTGNGDVQLPDSIPSGKYMLRAYTNWMRNFGDNFIFEKNISILNNAANQPVSILVKNNINKVSELLNVKIKAAVKTPAIRFYPESGSLIEGVSSIVAVKAQDSFGKGIPASGAILNLSGDTVAHFNCDTLGMGLFALMPLSGQKYHAQITTKTSKGLSVDIPQPLLKGFALRVSSTDSLVGIIINCNDVQLADVGGKIYNISGKHAGKSYFNKNLQISDKQILIKIPTQLLPDGITSIALTDDQNKPQCERLVYIPHKTKPLTITTDKTGYKSKEKVTVQVKAGEKANLSMAVVDAGMVPVQTQDIVSYLALQSEIKGNIEHPERYFDSTNVNRNKQLDMLLITQGWRDFVWRKLADSALRISYKAEDGFDVSGRVRQKFADKSIKDVNITLTAFKAKGQRLYTARTDTSGRYAINNLQLYGPQDVKLTARNDKGVRSGWLLMDSVNNTPLPVYAKPGVEIDTTSVIVKAVNQRSFDLTKSSMKNGIKLKEVKIKEKKKIVLSSGVSATEFGYPDMVYKITKKDEFFESLDNWLVHNVPGITVSPDQGVILNGLGGGASTSAVIVNGREIEPPLGKWILDPQNKIDVLFTMDDADRMMQQTIRQPYYDLSMDKVKTVIFRHLVGLEPEYGKTINVYLLYLTLVPNALDNKDFGAETASVDGYYQSRTFYKPLYDKSKDLNKTDLRTTIHWEPNIITDANGEATISFYNADPKTKVRVVAEGVKASGGSVTGSVVYKVN
ncbi:hypothetical protein KXQ82_19420 [Mucilaginibacter sp. HMF5004]|uniref:MG2 domain-containing protein n=1 Tax=Mucilaginibacter rivuli TaxID=2857527 RepID=UPI001C5F25D8|nr:MG2 domain-containing protein [Mucilaginibacter rivuli]MBW4891903.1 hypothetical protein [Mucilaginibacter rivuli]